MTINFTPTPIEKREALKPQVKSSFITKIESKISDLTGYGFVKFNFSIGVGVKKILMIGAIVFASFFASEVYAMTPTISISPTGYAANVTITVNGDPNSSVILNYSAPNYSNNSVTLGTTNSSGFFQTTISSISYNFPVNTTVYVTVNNQTSASVAWPYNQGYNSGGNYNYGNFYLSQNNLTLSVGQSAAINFYNNFGSAYVNSNSNSNVASASISGSQITIYGNSPGNATFNICSSSGSYNCSTIYVTVTGNYNYYPYNQYPYYPYNQSLTFSPSNPMIPIGQSVSVSVSGGSGSYYISSNSNSGVVTANISNNFLTLYGVANGSSVITICSSNNACGTLTVNVGNTINFPGYNYSGASYSLTPVLSSGQGINLIISGGATPYTISSSNNSIFTANITNGNILTLYGVSAGSGTVNVCSYNGGCLPVNVVVVGSGYGYGYTTGGYSGSSGYSGGYGSYGGSYSGGYGGGYTFGRTLRVGSTGDDVTQLQQILTDEGVFTGPITGYYGSLTQSAVKSYQIMHELDPTGILDSQTRAILNS